MGRFDLFQWQAARAVEQVHLLYALNQLIDALHEIENSDGESRQIAEVIKATEELQRSLAGNKLPKLTQMILDSSLSPLKTFHSQGSALSLCKIREIHEQSAEYADWEVRLGVTSAADTLMDHGDAPIEIDLYLQSIIRETLLYRQWQKDYGTRLQQASRVGNLLPLLEELRATNHAARDCLARMNGKIPYFVPGHTKRWLQSSSRAVVELLSHNEKAISAILENAPELANRVRDQRLSETLNEVLALPSLWNKAELLRASFLAYWENVESLGKYQVAWDCAWLDNVDHVYASDFEVKEECDLSIRFALMIIQLWDETAKLHCLPEDLWNATQQWITQLTRGSGSNFDLVRARCESDGCYIVEMPPEALGRVLATGLVRATKRGGQTERTYVTQATLSLPKTVPAVYDSLLRVSVMFGEGLGDMTENCRSIVTMMRENQGAADLKTWLNALPEQTRGSAAACFESLARQLLLVRSLPGSHFSEEQKLTIDDLYSTLRSHGVSARPARAEELQPNRPVQLHQGLPQSGWRTSVVEWFDENTSHPEISVSTGPQAAREENVSRQNLGLREILADRWDRLELLRADSVEWDGWKIVQNVALSIFDQPLDDRSGNAGQNSQESVSAWQLFELFRGVIDEVNEWGTSEEFRYFASCFYASFTRARGKSFPVWDVAENRLVSLKKGENWAVHRVEWECDPSPPGTILKVLQWGIDEKAAYLSASCGMGLSKDARKFLALPWPKFTSPDSAVGKFALRICDLPFVSNEENAFLKDCLRDLQKQLGSESETNRLNDCIHRLLSDSSPSDERDWWNLLLSVGISIHPKVDLTDRSLLWRENTRTLSDSITFHADPSHVDTVLSKPGRNEVRFATRPESCRVILSQGDDPLSPLSHTCEAIKVVQSELTSPNDLELQNLIKTSLWSVRDFDRGLKWTESRSIGQVFCDILQMILTCHKESRGHATEARLTKLLKAIAIVASDHGVSVSPPLWSFDQRSEWRAEWGDQEIDFSTNQSLNSVSLVSFGVTFEGVMLQQAKAICSVGPYPPGYESLMNLVEKCMQSKSFASSANAIHKSLKKLPILTFQAESVPQGPDSQRHPEEFLLAELTCVYRSYRFELRPLLEESGQLKPSYDNFVVDLVEARGLKQYPGSNCEFMTDFNSDLERWFDYSAGNIPLDSSTAVQGPKTKRGKIANVIVPGLYRKNESQPRVMAKVRLQSINSNTATL